MVVVEFLSPFHLGFRWMLLGIWDTFLGGTLSSIFAIGSMYPSLMTK